MQIICKRCVQYSHRIIDLLIERVDTGNLEKSDLQQLKIIINDFQECIDYLHSKYSEVKDYRDVK